MKIKIFSSDFWVHHNSDERGRNIDLKFKNRSKSAMSLIEISIEEIEHAAAVN